MSQIPVDQQERRTAYATVVTDDGLSADEVINYLNDLIDRSVHWATQELAVLEAAGVLNGEAIVALQKQHPDHDFVVLTDGRRWSRPVRSATAYYRPYDGGELSSNCGCGRPACS